MQLIFLAFISLEKQFLAHAVRVDALLAILSILIVIARTPRANRLPSNASAKRASNSTIKNMNQLTDIFYHTDCQWMCEGLLLRQTRNFNRCFIRMRDPSVSYLNQLAY